MSPPRECLSSEESAADLSGSGLARACPCGPHRMVQRSASRRFSRSSSPGGAAEASSSLSHTSHCNIHTDLLDVVRRISPPSPAGLAWGKRLQPRLRSVRRPLCQRPPPGASRCVEGGATACRPVRMFPTAAMNPLGAANGIVLDLLPRFDEIDVFFYLFPPLSSGGASVASRAGVEGHWEGQLAGPGACSDICNTVRDPHPWLREQRCALHWPDRLLLGGQRLPDGACACPG
jgi:hypothetical protein